MNAQITYNNGFTNMITKASFRELLHYISKYHARNNDGVDNIKDLQTKQIHQIGESQ